MNRLPPAMARSGRGFHRPNRTRRYGVAILGVILALALRFGLDPLLKAHYAYLPFFLAILAAARYGGRGPGLLAVGLSTLAAVYFFLAPRHTLTLAHLADLVGLVLFVGTAATIALLTASQREASRRQHTFVRDILFSVTEGKLTLCEAPRDLPAPRTAFGEPVLLSATAGLRELRRTARDAAAAAGLSPEQAFDLEMAVGEAGMNAIVHAGGGTGSVSVDGPGGQVQVWVRDDGSGIAVEDLPRATLQPGFTTAGTLGFGMKMMLQTAHRVYLLTGSAGTTVVLEQSQEQKDPVSDWPVDSLL